MSKGIGEKTTKQQKCKCKSELGSESVSDQSITKLSVDKMHGYADNEAIRQIVLVANNIPTYLQRKCRGKFEELDDRLDYEIHVPEKIAVISVWRKMLNGTFENEKKMSFYKFAMLGVL